MKAAEALQAILNEKHLTRVDLSKMLDVTSQCIDVRCNGKSRMQTDTLAKTFGALDYKIIACPRNGKGTEYEIDG